MRSLAAIVFALTCAAAALAPLGAGTVKTAALADGFPGWPRNFAGRALTELPLTQIERRFQQNFPGRVGRFTDGKREIIIRWAAESTRKLHPSGDCFKANGYALTAQPVKIIGNERWSGFIATRGGQQFDVRERIHDGAGGQWSDVSAWYWSAQLGRTTGPWWAVTVASKSTP